MRLGFTGTRDGMTPAQMAAFLELLRELKPIEFHHGDCIGADEQAHEAVRAFDPDIYIVIHPPEDDRYRAWCTGHLILAPKPYLIRNHDIVNQADYMAATPAQLEEQFRGSGTWAAIRYSKNVGRNLRVLKP